MYFLVLGYATRRALFPLLPFSPIPSLSSSSSIVTLRSLLLRSPHPASQLEVAVLFPVLCPWLEWKRERRQVGSRRRGKQMWDLLEAIGKRVPNVVLRGSKPYLEP